MGLNFICNVTAYTFLPQSKLGIEPLDSALPIELSFKGGSCSKLAPW